MSDKKPPQTNIPGDPAPHQPKVVEINLDGPCPPPPGKSNPKPIPPGGHSLLPGGAQADSKLAPLALTNPDPMCVEAEAKDAAGKSIGVKGASGGPGNPGPDVAINPGAQPGEMPPAWPLTVDQTQLLMELIEKRRKSKPDDFEIPDLPIHDDDKERLQDCLLNGNMYAESFDRAKGSLKVTFRVKTARETEIVFAQLRQDARDGFIMEEWDMNSRLHKYNLLIQMHSLNDIQQPRAVPLPAEMPKDWTLRSIYDSSLVSSFPDPKIYILLGILSQFDKKVRRMTNQVLNGDF